MKRKDLLVITLKDSEVNVSLFDEPKDCVLHIDIPGTIEQAHTTNGEPGEIKYSSDFSQVIVKNGTTNIIVSLGEDGAYVINYPGAYINDEGYIVINTK